MKSREKRIICAVVIGGMAAIWCAKSFTDSGIAEKAEDFVMGEAGKVDTITETTLEEAVRMSRLYTAEYPYNGYTAVCDTDSGEIKYYVAYEGTVKAGIDVNRIHVSLEKESNTIRIILPEIEVSSPVVDAGTMEYIFTDEKYNTETVAQEAYKAANSDLMQKASEDSNIIATARESAKMAAKTLVEPWVNQIGTEETYTVKVLAYSLLENPKKGLTNKNRLDKKAGIEE